MREVILFSMLSFILIFLGVFYFMGFITIAPPRAVEEQIVADPEVIKDELESIEAQRAALERKRRAVQIAENDLITQKRIIEEEKSRLNQMMKRIEKLVGKLDEEEAKKVSKLAKLYESMKPQDAAKIASSLDIDMLTNIVASMKEKKAAKMLSALPPKKAAEISRRLGRSKSK